LIDAIAPVRFPRFLILDMIWILANIAPARQCRCSAHLRRPRSYLWLS
jgi:hypothetical protein